jgi:hypothetical protein
MTQDPISGFTSTENVGRTQEFQLHSSCNLLRMDKGISCWNSVFFTAILVNQLAIYIEHLEG